MAASTTTRLSVALAAITAGVLGALISSPGTGPAAAAPDPCAASSIAKTIGNVATNTGVYLDAHPDTNSALTAIAAQQAGPQSVAMLKTYFDANPQAGKDLQSIQQPISVLTMRCNLPISLPQLLGLLQSAQGAGAGAPATGPATAPAPAQTLAGTAAGPSNGAVAGGAVAPAGPVASAGSTR